MTQLMQIMDLIFKLNKYLKIQSKYFILYLYMCYTKIKNSN